MSNSIHFEQLFERFSRFLDRNLGQPEKEGEGSMGLLERVTEVSEVLCLGSVSFSSFGSNFAKAR